MDQGRPSTGGPSRSDDVARHDRAGHVEDRRHVPDREVARSLRDLAASFDPHSEWGAGKVDPAACRGQLPQRLSSGGCASSRARDRMGRSNQSLRGRERSHCVYDRRRAGAAQLALYRPLLPHQPRHTRQDQRNHDVSHCGDCSPALGDVPRKRGHRRRRQHCFGSWTKPNGRALETEQRNGASDEIVAAWRNAGITKRAKAWRLSRAELGRRRGCVHLDHVLLEHSPSRESWQVGPNRAAHDPDPPPRHRGR